jgi:hypothetical protein
MGWFWQLSDTGQVLFMAGFTLVTIVAGVLAGKGLADDVFGPRNPK